MPRIYKPQNELGNNLVDITKIGYNNGNEFEEGFITIQNKIEAEETRATAAETQLQTNIDNEETRATQAENNLQEKINEEYERAVDVETKLQENITNEATFRQLGDSDLQQQIYAEIADAKQRESIIAGNLITETERATAAENALNDKITAEETRASGVESELDTRISDLENSVIKTIESDSYINANNTEANKVNLTVNVSTGNNNSSVSSTDEENTLTRVKDVNAAITYEVNRATTKENELDAAITAEVSRAQGVESGFNTRINTLEANEPKIISVTGQTITNPTEITMGSEMIFSTDSDIAIDTVLSSITQEIAIDWTVQNTGSTTISVTNGGEEIASVDANGSVSGKWIRISDGVYISVFKRALGEEGNDWIAYNDGVLKLNYPENPPNFLNAIRFFDYSLRQITGTTGGLTSLEFFFHDVPTAAEVNLILPKITYMEYAFSGVQMENVNLDAPALVTAYQLLTSSSLKSVSINFPLLPTVYGGFLSDSIESLSFSLAKMQTITIPQSVIDVDVMLGGLNSCTSLSAKNSTNITATSIQNLIDALPDYSTTGTEALVSFPPDRLTEEQQTQITNKGWTWA